MGNNKEMDSKLEIYRKMEKSSVFQNSELSLKILHYLISSESKGNGKTP